MSLVRELVALQEALAQRGESPFADAGREAAVRSAGAGDALQQLRSLGCADPERVLVLCLQALLVQRSEFVPRIVEAELVATLPPSVPGVTRPTEQVVLEMLRAPRREVVLLGYEVSDERLMQLLARAAASGATVVAICDRERGAARRVLERWPAGVPRPRLFEDCERSEAAPFASMHAKCLLVDGEDLLVTSANFTFHGLHGNIENRGTP
ncbi:MAG: phospholipase D-like domain-containing protein [Myxococcales bacterium]